MPGGVLTEAYIDTVAVYLGCHPVGSGENREVDVAIYRIGKRLRLVALGVERSLSELYDDAELSYRHLYGVAVATQRHYCGTSVDSGVLLHADEDGVAREGCVAP